LRTPTQALLTSPYGPESRAPGDVHGRPLGPASVESDGRSRAYKAWIDSAPADDKMTGVSAAMATLVLESWPAGASFVAPDLGASRRV